VIGTRHCADAARLRRAALIALGLDLAGGGLLGLALRLPAARGAVPGPAEMAVFLADDIGTSPAPDRAAAPDQAAAGVADAASPKAPAEAAPLPALTTPSGMQSAVAEGPTTPQNAASAAMPATATATAPAESAEAGNPGTPAGSGGVAADGMTENELLARIETLVGERLSYPPLARQRNIEGVVELSLTVARDGSLAESWLFRSSGSAILDRAARNLVRAVFPIPLSRNLAADLSTTIRIAYRLR